MAKQGQNKCKNKNVYVEGNVTTTLIISSSMNFIIRNKLNEIYHKLATFE
jgi:hypothetical protein